MESMPNQFVSAMQTLFDIMDDKHTGYVKLTDIENRWRDDRTKGLPRGVVESLQKAASHDGLLTFDRFCTGLKICLLRNQVQNTNKVDTSNEEPPKVHKVQTHRNPSAINQISVLDIHEKPNRDRNWGDTTIADNVTQHRTISMPLLIPRKDIQAHDIHQAIVAPPQKPDPLNGVYSAGPPKPPRLEKTITELSRTIKSGEESYALEDTKQDILQVVDKHRGHGDGRSNTESTQVAVRRVPRRREPRRHTLHNGVDYNLLKRMKQIEQEKDILIQGLGSIEEAREWYLKQLAEVQEKMRYAGRMGAYVEPWTEAQQERLELLRARVTELNRQLGSLAHSWHRGPLSLHMNLALPAAPNFTSAEPVLRSQNRMLSDEVNRKNERISVLEREKSALIRELLLQRNRSKIIENLTICPNCRGNWSRAEGRCYNCEAATDPGWSYCELCGRETARGRRLKRAKQLSHRAKIQKVAHSELLPPPPLPPKSPDLFGPDPTGEDLDFIEQSLSSCCDQQSEKTPATDTTNVSDMSTKEDNVITFSDKDDVVADSRM